MSGNTNNASHVYYIKLGEHAIRDDVCDRYLYNKNNKGPGIWVGFHAVSENAIRTSIEKELAADPEEKTGDRSHRDCVREFWTGPVRELKNAGCGPTASSTAAGVIRKVCMADSNDYFFTFHDGFLWWCQPSGGKGEDYRFDESLYAGSSGSRGTDLIRMTTPWSNERVDKHVTLDEYKICGQLTRKQMIQGTMCELLDDDADRFRWTIGVDDPPKALVDFTANEKALTSSIAEAIGLLGPTDFELFVDMVFVNNGWLRMGGVGSNTKAIDGKYKTPVTNKNVYVQVKASLSKEELRRAVIALYEQMGNDEDAGAYLVYHSLSLGKSLNRMTVDMFMEYMMENKEELFFESEDKKQERINEGKRADFSKWLRGNFKLMGRTELAKLSFHSNIIRWLKESAYAVLTGE